mmetsp:Transcript_41167/g.94965  ORF Transcript_41167/g.94965 Transcript_41167/m.94965 type:complete len:211 (-) Transcript_41167:784-1416(-)
MRPQGAVGRGKIPRDLGRVAALGHHKVVTIEALRCADLIGALPAVTEGTILNGIALAGAVRAPRLPLPLGVIPAVAVRVEHVECKALVDLIRGRHLGGLEGHGRGRRGRLLVARASVAVALVQAPLEVRAENVTEVVLGTVLLVQLLARIRTLAVWVTDGWHLGHGRSRGWLESGRRRRNSGLDSRRTHLDGSARATASPDRAIGGGDVP